MYYFTIILFYKCNLFHMFSKCVCYGKLLISVCWFHSLTLYCNYFLWLKIHEFFGVYKYIIKSYVVTSFQVLMSLTPFSYLITIVFHTMLSRNGDGRRSRHWWCPFWTPFIGPVHCPQLLVAHILHTALENCPQPMGVASIEWLGGGAHPVR